MEEVASVLEDAQAGKPEAQIAPPAPGLIELPLEQAGFALEEGRGLGRNIARVEGSAQDADPAGDGRGEQGARTTAGGGRGRAAAATREGTGGRGELKGRPRQK